MSALMLQTGPGDPSVRTRADAAVPIARAALIDARRSADAAAARTCGLDNREREVERLDAEYRQLSSIVRPYSDPITTSAGSIVYYGDQFVGRAGWPACKRPAEYHAHVIALRTALRRAREALGLGE